MPKDLYAVLGVPRNADAQTIKKTFYKLATQLHPDKNPGDKAAEARFKEVSHAHDVLSDSTKRSLYDEFGEDGLREGFDVEQARAYKAWASQGRGAGSGGSGFPGGVRIEDLFNQSGIGDIFSNFGGAFRGNARQRSKRGHDLEGEVTIDFASAVRGGTVTLTMRQGQGELPVRIPAGAQDGDKVRVPGKGAPSQVPDGTPGDLILTIHVTPHPHFRREGNDLHLSLPLTIHEAYFGGRIKVPTLDGFVQMKVPPRTQSGQQLRLKGKGIARKGQEPGDMYVHFLMVFPKQDDPQIAKLIEQMAAFDSDPRENIAL